MKTQIMQKIKAVICLLAFLAPIAQAGRLDRSKVPGPGPAPDIELGTFDTFTLENGLKVFVVENHKIPMVSLYLLIDRDPVVEGESVGYLEATGGLLRRGTANRSKSEIDEAVDFLGADLNTTSTSISASSLSKHMPELFALVSDIVLHAEFSQEELDKIKKQTISRIKSQKDQPQQIARNVSQALLYGKNHPYGEVSTEASVESITLDQCKAYFQTYFRPNTAYLALVGDITLDQAKSMVESNLSEWQRAKVPTHEYDRPTLPEKPHIAVVDKAGAVQTVINITNITDLKPGSEDVIASRVANTLLGGPSFRLYKNLREEHNYTYGAYSQLSWDPLIGRFNAFGQVRNEVTKDAVGEFLKELNRIRDEKVDEDELQLVKNFLTGSFARTLESPETVAQFAIDADRYDLPAGFHANYLKNLDAVSIEDIQAVANKHILPGNALIVAVGEASALEKELADYGDIQRYDTSGDPVDPNAAELPEGLTAVAVLDKYFAALGGIDNIKKVQSSLQKGSLSVSGMSLDFTRVKQSPNKEMAKAEMSGQVMFKQIFDGEKAQVTQMGRKVPIQGDALEEMKIQAPIVPELFFKESGVELSLAGAEKLDGRIVYKVETAIPGGRKSTVYFDAESGLKVKQVSVRESQGGSMTQILEFKEYQEVDGIKMPFLTSQQAGAQVIEIKTTSITFNTEVEPDTFKIEE